TIKATKKTVSELVAENGAASRAHLSQAIRKGAEQLGEMDGKAIVEKHHVALSSLVKSAAAVHGWSESGSAETNRAAINLMVLGMVPEKLVKEMGEARETDVEAEESRG